MPGPRRRPAVRRASAARQRRLSAALRASRAAQWAILDAALDCIVTIDAGGRIVEFNPAAERTFGFLRAEVLGRPLAETIVPPAYRAAHQQGFARYLAGGARRVLGRRVELEAARKDGTLLPVELAITEVRVGGRRMFTAYLRDLSERRAAEGELLRQREALHQRQKMAALGSLLAGVAHELNNPLAIVVGQAQLLLETSTEPAARQRAAKIQAAAERCARIVRAFLDMARKREPVRRDVELNALVAEALGLVAYGLRASGIEVRPVLEPALPRISADPDQLHQVVTNLLINAQHALEDRPEPRYLVVRTRAGKRGFIRLEVSDNGPGIPPEVRPRIFEPFFTTKPTGAGTGVGLSVTHAMVEQHGGRLSFSETPGGGATFAVELPLAAVPPAAPVRRRVSVPKAHTRQALVVDDEPEIAKLVREVLQADGFVVD